MKLRRAEIQISLFYLSMFNIILSRKLKVHPLVNIMERKVVVDKTNCRTKGIIFFYFHPNHNLLSLKTFCSLNEGGYVQFITSFVTNFGAVKKILLK